MGSRWDLLDENRPFAGSDAMPPGHELYPRGLTRDQIEQYVAQHPTERAAIYNPFTVIKRQGDRLIAVPYHTEYKQFLEPMAKDLRDAASLSDDPAFASFLRLRASALLSDDYYGSDLAWLDLKDPKFDIIFAPYETYLDDLLAVKTSYGASLLIRNEAESRKLAVYQKYVSELQDAPRGHPSAVISLPWKSWTRPTARATCFTATRRWPTISPTIRSSTRRRAARKFFSRISWTPASTTSFCPSRKN